MNNRPEDTETFDTIRLRSIEVMVDAYEGAEVELEQEITPSPGFEGNLHVRLWSRGINAHSSSNREGEVIFDSNPSALLALHIAIGEAIVEARHQNMMAPTSEEEGRRWLARQTAAFEQPADAESSEPPVRAFPALALVR